MDKNIFRKTEATLYGYNELVSKIKCLELEIDDIENSYSGCGAIGYEEKTGSTNKFNSSVENEIIEKERIINNLKRDLYSKKILKEKIDSTIERMNDSERKLVELRYTNRNTLSWDQVGYILGFNPDYCRQKLRRKIINKISDTIFVNPYKQEKLKL